MSSKCLSTRKLRNVKKMMPQQYMLIYKSDYSQGCKRWQFFEGGRQWPSQIVTRQMPTWGYMIIKNWKSKYMGRGFFNWKRSLYKLIKPVSDWNESGISPVRRLLLSDLWHQTYVIQKILSEEKSRSRLLIRKKNEVLTYQSIELKMIMNLGCLP